jgi:hypothetical protein
MFASAGLLLAPIAWWSGSHMLVAEIARQSLHSSEVAALEAVLVEWEHEFPGTSDLTGAAVWADNIKCSRVIQPYCLSVPALSAFNSWHYNDIPFSPDGLTIPDYVQALSTSQPSASWAISEAVRSFKVSQSRWVINFMLRMAVHLVADVHQPLHAVDGYFNDSQYGDLPRGDAGGNAIHVAGALRNLHAVWDSAGGLYTFDWPLNKSQQALLRANATSLAVAHPPGSFSWNISNELADCWDSYGGCGAEITGWVRQSHALAVELAYPNVTNGLPLPPGYLQRVQRTSQAQVALGGYRLAELLRRAVQSSEQWSTRGDSLQTRVKALESERSVLIVLCAFTSTSAAAVLAAACCSRRRKTMSGPSQLSSHRQLVEITCASGHGQPHQSTTSTPPQTRNMAVGGVSLENVVGDAV